MGIIKEFKEFAIKGNMVDMAVGIIIGTAFNNVVQALVKQVIMPPFSIMTDGLHYADKKYVLREATVDSAGREISEIAIGYGVLLEVTIDFLVIGAVLFLVVKLMNRVRNHAQNPDDKKAVTPKDIELLNDLKQLMKEQNDMLAKKQ